MVRRLELTAAAAGMMVKVKKARMTAAGGIFRPIRKDSREAICTWVKQYRDKRPLSPLSMSPGEHIATLTRAQKCRSWIN